MVGSARYGLGPAMVSEGRVLFLILRERNRMDRRPIVVRHAGPGDDSHPTAPLARMRLGDPGSTEPRMFHHPCFARSRRRRYQDDMSAIAGIDTNRMDTGLIV